MKVDGKATTKIGRKPIRERTSKKDILTKVL
jgi:hypothetical protein